MSNPKSSGLNIGLVTIPFQSSFGNPVNRVFVEIMEGACDRLYFITGDPYLREKVPSEKIYWQEVKPVKPEQWWLVRIFKYIPAQLKICANLKRVSSHFNIIVFSTGGMWLVLPVLYARLLRVKIVLVVNGSASKVVRRTYSKTLFGKGGVVFYYIFRILQAINCTLSDKIVVPAERFVDDFELGRYRSKIIIGNYNQTYINNRFRTMVDWQKRENIVGYVGRLSAEKGTMELAQAILLIIARKSDVKFLIVGAGPLMTNMKRILEEAGCLDKVVFTDGVMPEMVPGYLNQMKFHILPSYTETSSASNLEAMACGTIAIANSVGGLLDSVKDNETGFLLRDNLPQTIADKVIEVWDHPRLAEIQKRAKAFVQEKFAYERAVESWKQIFANLDS